MLNRRRNLRGDGTEKWEKEHEGEEGCAGSVPGRVRGRGVGLRVAAV